MFTKFMPRLVTGLTSQLERQRGRHLTRAFEERELCLDYVPGMDLCVHEPMESDLSPLLKVLHTHSKAVSPYGIQGYSHHYPDPSKPVVVPKSLIHLQDPTKYG
ncbi:hypothetical protein AMECASPLE_028773 [Ameca splendens]|uniref:Uncharacterized protein n=1 Tax=Ameca splendens TaxID=208324 RepID=A0ABV0YSM5_9TELE